MEQIKNIVEWQEVSGEPISIGETTLTPQSQALSIRLPFGGLVWNRPVSVMVEQGGESRQIPIVDVTRQAVLALAVTAVAVAILGKLMRLFS